MKEYIFTLFVRFFITLSGFIVFLATSKLFGAEGRGIIGYGTSMISLVALILSFNLGRTFLAVTGKNTNLKNELLPKFISMSFILMLIAIVIILVFWTLSKTAQQVIDKKLLLCFLILVPNYLWGVNSNAIYASVNKILTHHQIILWGRLALIIFVSFFLIFKIHDIQIFVLGYAAILSFFSIFEMTTLAKPSLSITQFKCIKTYIVKSFNVHIDYLSFNLFPLVLILVAGLSLSLKDLGKLNFLIQLTNFVFTISIVGSILMKKYVSDKGFMFHKKKIKLLFSLTLTLSFVLFIVVYSISFSYFFKNHLPDFQDTYKSFWILGFSLLGYATYQIAYPVLIEYKCMDLLMKTNLIVFSFSVIILIPLINFYGFTGACVSFSLFYVLIFVSLAFILFNKTKLIHNRFE